MEPITIVILVAILGVQGFVAFIKPPPPVTININYPEDKECFEIDEDDDATQKEMSTL